MPEPKPSTAPAVEEEQEPSAPVVEVDPAPDEEGDAVELVRTGFIRLRFGGETYKLRRPFFGELKTLRLALEDAADVISDAAEDSQLLATKLIEEAQAQEDDTDLDAEARVKARRALQKQSRVAGRKLTQISEDERIGWWELVISTLGVSDTKAPERDQFPSWIIDPNLPNTVLQHWRSVPLGRG